MDDDGVSNHSVTAGKEITMNRLTRRLTQGAALAAMTGGLVTTCAGVAAAAPLSARSTGAPITTTRNAAHRLGDTPPAPAGTTSFSYTSTITVPGWKTRTIYSGCPAGWFVRLGQPDAWGDNDPNPSYSEWTTSSLLKQTPGVGANVNTQYGNSGLYQNITDEFTNLSVDTHHATMTFWCDAVPSWLNTATGAVKGSAHVAKLTATPAHTTSATAQPPAAPIKDSCYYCEWDASLKNGASGNYLTPSGMSPTPVTFNLAGDATGEYVGVYGSASYGIWTMGDVEREDAMGTNGDSVFWQYSPNSIPANGQFILDDHGAGASSLGAMLILSSSVSRGTAGQTGSGGMCLADSSGQVGAQPTLEPCDATNQSQYWAMN
jgi:hypothetical protein